MTITAKIRISQLLPSPGTKDSRSKDFSAQGDYNVTAGAGGESTGSFGVHHLPAVQYPKAIAGQEGWTTEDHEDWSDSPTLDPTRKEDERFSYGRGPDENTPGVYGRLSEYSGLLINQVTYSKSGLYNINDVQEDNEYRINHLSEEVSGSVVVYEPEQVSSDVTISQFPFIVLANPEPFSYKNPVDTDVSIRLSNYVFPLNSGTITLTLEGESKSLDISEFVSGLGGFDSLWSNDKNFDYDQVVDVVWEMFDEADPPNQILIEYWFRTINDFLGPRITNISPADDSTDIPKDSCIGFNLRDFEKGVNLDSLEIYVNNLEIDNSLLTITELSSQDGYSVEYCPDKNFLYGDEIPVSVYVEDLSTESNVLFEVFSFTIEQSLAPQLVDYNPEPCDINVPNVSDVEFTIVDGGHGLDKESIEMGVDDKSQQPRKRPIIFRDE